MRGDAEDAEGAGLSSAFWAAMNEAAANGEVPNPDEFYEYVQGKGIKGREAGMLYNLFYPSDGSADDDSNILELQRHAVPEWRQQSGYELTYCNDTSYMSGASKVDTN